MRDLLDGFSLSGLIAAVAFLALGAFLGARRPLHAISWVALGIAFTQAVSLASSAYGFEGLERDWPASHWAVWASQWTWVPGYLAVPTLLLLLFPDGRIPGRKWLPALVLCAGAIVSASAGWALLPYEKQDSPLDMQVLNPLASDLGEPLMGLGAVLGIVAAAVALASLAVRFRGSAGTTREQLKWVFVAGGVTAGLLGLAVVVGPDLGAPIRAIATVPVPAAIGVAISRHRLWDVDIVINRALVYGVLTICVMGFYVATVAGAGRLIRERTGAPLLAVALVAVVIEPLRQRLQALANRLLFGDRDDPYAAVSKLSQRLDALHPEESAVSDVPRIVARTLRLPYVAIEVGDQLRAEAGKRTFATERFPLSYRGAPVGDLVVGFAETSSLEGRQRNLLMDLARHIGVALHSERLARELQLARAELVGAREEERRRLRRDLHDDLGPTLAAAALQVETAFAIVESDSDSASARLEKVAGRIREAVGSVRSIVEDLGPPALDELGLADAIRQQIASHASEDITFELDMPDDLGPLPAAVEVAAYRILSEAVTNISKHAGPTRCLIEVDLSDGLRIRVIDHGRGGASFGGTGMGLRSMLERAAELGGELLLESDATGTKVAAWLPVAPG
jgi:signal transduction histidine kinase